MQTVLEDEFELLVYHYSLYLEQGPKMTELLVTTKTLKLEYG